MRLAVRVLMGAALLIACGATPALARDVRDYLGKTITDVRVEAAGVLLTEAAVLDLIETRVGEPLAMREVRATIEHLVGVGRFEDVRVFASATDQGVALQ